MFLQIAQCLFSSNHKDMYQNIEITIIDSQYTSLGPTVKSSTPTYVSNDILTLCFEGH